MFLSRAIAKANATRATVQVLNPRAASSTPAEMDIADFRTGQILSGAVETETGEPMTAEAGYNYHAWYRAISLIAQKCASVPKYVYVPDPAQPEGRRRDLQHFAHKLVNIQANEEQTAFDFWLQMAGHVASRGNGFALLWRITTGGPPLELIPMDPDLTYPVREGGKLWYVCYPFGMGEGEKGFREPAENVLHFKGFGFDGLTGYPVWEVAAQELGLARAERKMEATRYRNGGRPSMILESPTKLPVPVKRRIIEDWERMHVGLNNAGRTAILDGGMKANPIAMDAEELGQTGAAQMSILAIANYTGVPVSKLGGGKSYANQEHEDRAFVADGLDFYLNALDTQATFKLLPEPDRVKGAKVESDREALIRTDTKTLYETIRTGTAGRPVLTPNEGRAKLGLPRDPDPLSDKLLNPLNMGQGGEANEPENVADAGPGRPTDDTPEAPAAPDGNPPSGDTPPPPSSPASPEPENRT